MIKSGSINIIIILALSLILYGSCGKKAPPSLGEEILPLEVKKLQARWEENDVLLEGNLTGPEHLRKDPSAIKGCRIYHGHYPLENYPCEKCPIDYSSIEDGEVNITEKGHLICRKKEIKKKGVHFFKISIVGKEGSVGPASKRVKVVIEK